MSSYAVRLVRINVDCGWVSGTAGAVLMHMAHFANHKGRGVIASNETIGARLSPPKTPRTVSRAKTKLKALGWIKMDGSAMQNGHKNERWALNMEMLYKCDPLGSARTTKCPKTGSKQGGPLGRQKGVSLGRQNDVLITNPPLSGSLVETDPDCIPENVGNTQTPAIPDGADETVIPFPDKEEITEYLKTKKHTFIPKG
jgi:hypothetical protein